VSHLSRHRDTVSPYPSPPMGSRIRISYFIFHTGGPGVSGIRVSLISYHIPYSRVYSVVLEYLASITRTRTRYHRVLLVLVLGTRSLFHFWEILVQACLYPSDAQIILQPFCCLRSILVIISRVTS
jgi:hypothetical protein